MTASPDDDSMPVLEQYRAYLKLLANLLFSPSLQAKEGASDIVQQPMLDAHRDFADFRGKAEAELRAWLKKLREHLREDV